MIDFLSDILETILELLIPGNNNETPNQGE